MSRLREEIERKSNAFCRNKCGAPDSECKGCYAFSEWYQKHYGKYDFDEEDEE